MGYKIKEAREKKNMTQEELSSKSGISRVTISMLENGKTEGVKVSTLRKIASALNMSLEDLFFGITVK